MELLMRQVRLAMQLMGGRELRQAVAKYKG